MLKERDEQELSFRVVAQANLRLVKRFPGQTSSEIRSLSCEGRGIKQKTRRLFSETSAIFADIRYGARAFSTLEGYASRIRETELTPGARFKPKGTCGHRRGSRLNGKKADAKHLGTCALCWAITPIQKRKGPKGCAVMKLRFLGKEFCFAYF